MAHASSAVQSPRSSLCLYFLGSLRIEHGPQTIHFPTRKVELLLAYLVLHPQPHPREKLAALLWGDFADDQARQSLRNALTVIRKTLGDDLLLADRETVQLNPDFRLWVDVREFEQAASDDPPSAIDLYQGDLLREFYDEWIPPIQHRLHTLYLDMLLKSLQQARAESRYERAMELARKVLAIEPANEAAHQHLMFCYAVMGNRIAALQQYNECVRILRDELNVPPSSETKALRDQIERESTKGKSLAARMTNLPIPLTSLVGRQKEITEVKGLVRQHRLVTLTGSGGCGKTRLAIEVASELVESFPNGVWWVDLAPLANPSLVSQSVARALGVDENPKESVDETLATFLRDRQLLLILDNCEHLLAACSQLAHDLLNRCPRLKILTTSREATSISRELAWRVPSLSLPQSEILYSAEKLIQYEGLHLFAERAGAIALKWKFRDHALAVAHLCRRLDGIPLAIELAAARIKDFSVEEIATRLDDRFNLIIRDKHGTVPRHQSLRAALDWSYDLLSVPERTLLDRLSIFAGGWTLPAAETVCANSTLTINETDSSGDIQDLLTRLGDKSLIIADENRKPVRYHMLETIRQYAYEKLLETNEHELMANRHLDYYLSFAQNAEVELHGPKQLEGLDRLEIENDNWRAALDWSVGGGRVEKGLRLARALMEFWEMRSYWNEGRTRIEHLLNQPAAAPQTLERANALLVAARMTGLGGAGEAEKSRQYLDELVRIARESGTEGRRVLALGLCAWADDAFRKDPAASEAMIEEALAIARLLGDEWLLGRVLFMRGWLLVGTDNRAARNAFEASLEHLKSIGDPHWIARLSMHISSIDFKQGNLALAHRELEQALLFFRQIKAKREILYALNMLGEFERTQGKYDLAKQNYLEALELCKELGAKLGISMITFNLGFVALHEGDLDSLNSKLIAGFKLTLEINGDLAVPLMALASLAAVEKEPRRAVRLFAVVDAQLEQTDRRMLSNVDKLEYERYLTIAREQLDKTTFDAAWKLGKKMTLEQAIEYALNQNAP